MRFITGIDLVLENGEEITFQRPEISDIFVSGIVNEIRKIGVDIVELQQADNIFISIDQQGNYTYFPFNIGKETTAFARLLEKDVRISRLKIKYLNGTEKEIFAPDDDIQDIYEEGNHLIIDIYANDFSEQELEE